MAVLCKSLNWEKNIHCIDSLSAHWSYIRTFTCLYTEYVYSGLNGLCIKIKINKIILPFDINLCGMKVFIWDHCCHILYLWWQHICFVFILMEVAVPPHSVSFFLHLWIFVDCAVAGKYYAFKPTKPSECLHCARVRRNIWLYRCHAGKIDLKISFEHSAAEKLHTPNKWQLFLRNAYCYTYSKHTYIFTTMYTETRVLVRSNAGNRVQLFPFHFYSSTNAFWNRRFIINIM